jgi:hypothetical protein
MKLKQEVEKRKDFLIRKLIQAGHNKMADGRQLYELTLSELEHIYIAVRCKKGRNLPVESV